MAEAAFLMEVIKTLGISAIIFVIWLIYHRSTVKIFENIIAEQAKREEQNFNLLKEMIGTTNYHNSLLVEIKQKIDSNQWCPYVKNFQNKQEV